MEKSTSMKTVPFHHSHSAETSSHQTTLGMAMTKLSFQMNDFPGIVQQVRVKNPLELLWSCKACMSDFFVVVALKIHRGHEVANFNLLQHDINLTEFTESISKELHQEWSSKDSTLYPSAPSLLGQIVAVQPDKGPYSQLHASRFGSLS